MIELRKTNRYPLTLQREYRLYVASLDHDWKNFVVHLSDISMKGIGILSEDPIMPGFVWFTDRVGGRRCGVLLWSKKAGRLFRSGIRFLNLSREEELFLHRRFEPLLHHKPVRDPEAIITTMMDSLNRERVPAKKEL